MNEHRPKGAPGCVGSHNGKNETNGDCGKRLQARRLTSAVHVTAARLGFLVNVKGIVWAAARDGER